MVELPKKKVGIVACSGEELCEGTITRLAALRVLEQLRPSDTVTICLPLFLAGGEGDRAFARFYPTIAVDGCELRCATRATEMYSGKPAASVVVSELVAENGLDQPQGLRRLNEAGVQTVEMVSVRLAALVDELLGKRWDRRAGELIQPETLVPLLEQPSSEPVIAACSCGSGIPVMKITVNGRSVEIVALPLIFEQFLEAGKAPNEAVGQELMETVKIYNFIPVDTEQAYISVVLEAFAAFWKQKAAL
jgi:uncharacterized metal-binding protein